MKTESEPVPPPPRGERKNVIIIGAGVTGILTAWELARAGHSVTILEARKIGNGSSSRSAACIRQQFSTPSTVRGMRYCVGFYTMWNDLFEDSMLPIVQNGYLFLKDYSTNVEAVQATVAMQREAGLAEVEWLSPREQIDEKFPYLETTGIVGATWCPTDGFLHPHTIYNDGAEAAKKLGVTIVQNAEIANVVNGGGIVETVITTDCHRFSGDVFVNAAGVWSPRVSVWLGGATLDIKAHRRYLYFIKGPTKEVMVLDPSDMPKMPMVISPRGCYLRPDGSQFMLGWAHHTKPVPPDFNDQDRIEDGFGCRADYALAVRKEMSAYLPALTELGPPESATAGYYENSPDHNPFIGFDPNVPNLIHCAGFSGHGLMHAPFSAHIVAHLIAANCDLDEIELPGFGTVDLKPYKIVREPAGGENMVI